MMIVATYSNSDTMRVYGLTQYDYGQILQIQGIDIADGTEIHFCQNGQAITQYVQRSQVAIPDYLLQYPCDINAYVYASDKTSGQTVLKFILSIRSREKPGDYITPEEPAYSRLLPPGGMDGQYLAVKDGHYVWITLDDYYATEQEMTNVLGQIPVPISNLELEELLK